MSKKGYAAMQLLLASEMLSGYIVNARKLKTDDTHAKPSRLPMPNGVKKFEIDGKIVWALNEKNAIRKAKKQNSSSA